MRTMASSIFWRSNLPYFWTRKYEFLVLSRPVHLNAHGLFLAPCRHRYILQGCFSKKKRPFFQSTHLTRHIPRNLLRLKLEIVNTMRFILVLGLIRGYKYSYIYICEVK